MKALEQIIYARTPETDRETVFIVGAPRAGTTIVYQYLCQYTKAYIANVTNDYFAETPAVGLYVQKGWENEPVRMTASFGRAVGPMEPSEASQIFEKTHDLSRVVDVGIRLFGRPFIIKHAPATMWMDAIRTSLPGVRFIIVRRDLAEAAKSDVMSRYLLYRDPAYVNPRTHSRDHSHDYVEHAVATQVRYREAANNVLKNTNATTHRVWIEDFVSDATIRSNLVAFAGFKYQDYELPPKRSLQCPEPEARLIDRIVTEKYSDYRYGGNA